MSEGTGWEDGGDAGPGATVSVHCVPVRQEPWDGAEQGRPCPESHRVTRFCLESEGSRARAEAGTRCDGEGPGREAEGQEKISDVGSPDGRANRS